MTEHVLLQLSSVLIFGIIAQWLAARLRLPAIILLLLAGFLAGPITGFLHPDELLGPLLFPFISVSVGIILFEGSLSLRFSEIRQVGLVIRNLVTAGALLTWVLSAVAAYFILQLEFALAVQLGAILVVTGPTVIGPLVRFVRPVGAVSSILRWEGILIDPIGATLALLVFEFIVQTDPGIATSATIVSIIMTLVVGGAMGYLIAQGLIFVMRRDWVPDDLQNAVTLMSVVAAFVFANELQHESGLLATTVMGIVLANQKAVPIRRIIEFKENIGVLLVSSLFILLAARLDLSSFSALGWESFLFLAVMIFLVRPLTVFLSAHNSVLTWREKLFLSWMAPRGIVAASVTSVFALRLVESGYPQAEQLVPLMFIVIIGTCTIYGLTSLPLARYLNLSQANPQGLLIVGAHDWARALAGVLHGLNQKVVMVDTNPHNIDLARKQGIRAEYVSILADDVEEELDLQGIGRLLALTSNDEVNSLAALRFREVFKQAHVYQLPVKPLPEGRGRSVSHELSGRIPFGGEVDFNYFDQVFAQGAAFKAIPITSDFNYAAYRQHYGEDAQPLFIVDPSGQLMIMATEAGPTPQVGQTLISFILREPTPQPPDKRVTA